MSTTEKVVETGRRRRRRHSALFKAEAVGACQQPGVSIAAVALARRLNANLLRTCALSRGQDNAHARRTFHDLYANHRSDLVEGALRHFAELYEIEREARELKLNADARRQLRQQRPKPIAETFRQWLVRQRRQVPDGSATAKAIGYSLGRWAELIRYIEDGDLPIDNNHIENRIRPVALGRSNWLFAGSLRAGQRAATIMSLIQSAKLNGHDPYRYLKDVLECLPTQPASRLEELLPHRWQLMPHGH